MTDLNTSTNSSQNLFMRKLLLTLMILMLATVQGSLFAQSPLCASNGNNQNYEWVTRIKIHDGERTSGKVGYADFTGTHIATLTAGQTYNIEVDVRTNNITWHEYVKIWFDLNQDNIIQDPTELIYNQNANVLNFLTFSGTITIPTTAFSGIMYGRMIMQYAAAPALCGSYTYGTTYDVKANIVGGATNPVNRTITVSKAGNGLGEITSTPAGINTAIGVYSFDFLENTSVTLHASPTSPSTFTGWSGAATGTNQSVTVVLDANKTATANFLLSVPSDPTSISASSSSICSGSSTQLTANGGVGTVYWYSGSCGGTYIGQGNTITVSPGSTTTYFARNYNNGMFSTNCASTTVTVNPNPPATITASGPTTFCQGGSVALTASAGSSYLWSTGATTQTINATAAGNYTVTVTQANGCSAVSSPTTVAFTSGTDSDGDGRPDACDADDDNDGIPDALECNSSNFYWSNPPTVSGYTATGVINGISYTYTSSQPVLTTPTVFNHAIFPASYNVPNIKCIQNINASNNTLTFASPISNPVLVFASIGGGPISVPIEFSNPIDILWSTAVVKNSATRMTGTEGYAIVRLNGTFSSISFNYLTTENYVNFLFGADFQTCGDTDGDSIPDYLDTDSDGDGCSDAIEGDQNPSASQISNGRLTGGVDGNGIPLSVSGGQGLGTSQTANVNCHCQVGIDKTPPAITCLSNRTLASCETVLPNYTSLITVTDNCTTVVTQSPAPGTPIAPGTSVVVTMSATDPASNTSSCTFTVTRPDETPVAVDDAGTVCPGNSVTIAVLANDSHPQGKTLQINDFTQPAQGTVTQSGNNLIYTAPAGFSGPVTFKYQVKANDATVGFSENGHYYEWVPAYGISWTSAKAQAATKTYNGLQGYLVTITSATEMAFVAAKLQGSGWMGASDLAYEGTWRWVTGPEGLENGGLGRHFSNQNKYSYNNCAAGQGPAVGGYYNNWAGGEPNDCGAYVNQYSPTSLTRGGEHYAHFYGGGIWNDYPNSVGGSITGYIVEYGGLEGCLPLLTAEASVTINVKPTPVVTISPASVNVCPGTTTTLTASGADTYQWSNGATTASITAGAGTYTVTGTTNGCASSPVSATITANDNIAPVPNVSSLPTITGECGATVSAPKATDNCAGQVTGVTTDPTTYNTQGTFTITWKYDDGNGNQSTQTQTVVINDVTPPVISCAFNITVNTDPGQCGAIVNYNAPSATDNCGSGVLPTTLAGHTYMGTYGGHTYFLSNTATDPETAHANAIAAGGHLVTIGSAGENSFVSAMSPSFIWIGFTDRTSEGTFKWVTSEPVGYTNWNGGEPNNYQGNEDWAVINWGPNGTWNDWFYYSTALYVIEFEGGNIPTTRTGGLGSGAMFPKGTTTETWQATDAGGNTVTCSFTITVIDNQNPTITAPAAVTVNTDPGQCGTAKANVNLGTPIVNDNCPGVTYTNNAPAFFNKGTTMVTWTVKDAVNRTAIATQLVTVVDNEYPVLSGVPANQTVQCNAVPMPATVTATDNCPALGAVNYSQVKTDGSCPGNYTLSRTWTVKDASGNLTSATQIITVIDTEAPTFTRPADVTLFKDAACSVDASPSGAAGDVTDESDNCSAGLNATYSDVVVNNCEGTYTITRTWSLVDNCGNAAATQVQTITVKDNTAPTFTRPADVILYKDASCAVNDTPTGAAGDVTNESDNCSTGLNATYSDVVVNNCEGTYTITRTWSLVDNCGNAAATQVQTITVKDNTAPTFTRPADITIYTDANCSYDASLAKTGDVTNEADNCSSGIEATYSDVVTAGSCQGTHVITRTWSLVDNCGNAAATQVQTITVKDNTAPTFTRPADITIYTDASCSYDASLAKTGDATNEADNCSTGIEATYSDVVTAGSCQGTHVITRTWSLVDKCGNAAATQVQTITVADNTAPIVTYNVGTVFHCFDTTANNYSVPALAATDNCSSSLSYSYVVYGADNSVVRSGLTSNASGSFTVGVNTIKWAVTDDCGNTTMATTLVTINPPITGTINSFTVLPQGANANTLYLGYTPASSATITITAAGGTAPYTYSWSSSAPGSFTVVAGDPSSIKVTALSAGVWTYTATVTDAKGCVASFVKTITVVDVRCGNKMDKVLVCHNTGSAKNPWVQICIAPAAVATHLANGSYLGACVSPVVTTKVVKPVQPVQPQAEQVLVVYPNPNRGQFSLQLKGYEAGKVQIQILDSRGRSIVTRNVQVGYSIENVQFNLATPASGLYQVRVVSAKGVSTAQVVIAR